jgi:outer membrane protein OmpA-like peptidoglycan-associated protein
MLRQLLIVVPVFALAVGSTACATKKFVRTEVGAVNDKATTLAARAEENEQRIKGVDERVTQVDSKYDERVGTVDQKASVAGQTADQAKQAAAAADTRVTDLANIGRSLVYGVVLNESQGGFRFANASLPDEAKGQLDKLMVDVSAHPKAVVFEIEGHTDSSGGATLNEQIGLDRAEAVKRYLHEQHKVPLHKMNVISYGEAKPVDSNRTRAGRAKNRRVEVKVLSAESNTPAITARTGGN